MGIKEYIKKALYKRNVLIILITTLGLLPLFISQGGFYTFGDGTSQILPFLYETKRMFSSGIPLWSWNTYFGQDFLFSYAYYTTTNPFSWINILFPYEYLGIGYTFTLYLKLLLCGYISQCYFRKMGFDEKLSLLGSILYTFSSWTISALFYFMFLDPMLLFPYLLIFIERYLRGERHRYSGLAIAIFITIWINYYAAIGSILCATIYYFFRLYTQELNLTKRARITLQAILCVMLGMLLSAVLLLPVYYILRGTPRATIITSFDWYILPEKILSIIIPKISEGKTPLVLITSFYNNNAANISIFGILPAILYLIKVRNWVGWMFIIFLVLYITPFGGIFCLFTNLDYTRWAYALVLTIILASLFYIKKNGMPSKASVRKYAVIVGGCYGVAFAMTVYWRIKYDIPMEQNGWLLTALTFLLVLNLACLYYLSIKRKDMNNDVRRAILLASLCSVTQLICFSLWADGRMNGKDEKCFVAPSETNFTDSGFAYRYDFIEDTAYPMNAGVIYNKPNLRMFHSVRDSKLFDLTIALDTIEDKYVAFLPIKDREGFRSLMSVRYLVGDPTDGDIRNVSNALSEYKDYIPMGFSYDKYQIESDLVDEIRNKKKSNVATSMLDAISIKPEDEREISKYLSKTDKEADINLDSVITERKKIACDYFEGDSHGFKAHISTDTTRVIFFSVVDSPGFTATIDGKTAKTYETNLGMTAIIVPEGDHNIRFEFLPAGLKYGAIMSMIALIITTIIFFLEKTDRNTGKTTVET